MAKDAYDILFENSMKREAEEINETRARYRAFVIVFALLNLACLTGLDGRFYPSLYEYDNLLGEIISRGTRLCFISIVFFMAAVVMSCLCEGLLKKKSLLSSYIAGAGIAPMAYALEYVAYASLYPFLGAVMNKPPDNMKDAGNILILITGLVVLIVLAAILRPRVKK